MINSLISMNSTWQGNFQITDSLKIDIEIKLTFIFKLNFAD